jgi:quinoprotein glucose dehydrogenase
MEGLPRAKRSERDWLNALTYSVQSPPMVVRDVVLTPASICSYIINKEQIPGWIPAFDIRTGKPRWIFRTVPRRGDCGIDTWKDDSWAYAGRAPLWSMMSADEELGYIYIPTNTTASDYYGGHRHGDNLFAESVLCLDADTGKRVWHCQTVHHRLWDYDNPAAPILMNLTVDGRPVKMLAQVTKQGFLFAFDRVNGKPICPSKSALSHRRTSRARRPRPRSHLPPDPRPTNTRMPR